MSDKSALKTIVSDDQNSNSDQKRDNKRLLLPVFVLAGLGALVLTSRRNYDNKNDDVNGNYLVDGRDLTLTLESKLQILRMLVTIYRDNGSYIILYNGDHDGYKAYIKFSDEFINFEEVSERAVINERDVVTFHIECPSFSFILDGTIKQFFDWIGNDSDEPTINAPIILIVEVR